MTFEIAYTSLVVVAVVALLVWERFPGEVVAFIGLGALVVGGVVPTAEAFRGFGNPAAITIAGMFILSHGFERTGGIEALGERLKRWPLHSERAILLGALPLVMCLSAFLNNTAVVVIFVPLLVSLAKRHALSPSRLLMPLSFAAILGGSCTLIGTSTNLIVSELMAAHELKPLGMFEIGAVGLPMALVGLGYLLFVVPRLLPKRPSIAAEVEAEEREYLSEVIVREDSPLVGQHLESSAVARLDGVSVLEVIREGEMLLDRMEEIELHAGDRLVLTAPPAELRSVHELNGVELGEPGLGVELVTPHGAVVVEGIVAPNSGLLGKPIGDLGLRQRYGMAVLAVHRHASNLTGRLRTLRLGFGDILLMIGTRESCERLRQAGDFIVLDDVEQHSHRRDRLPLAIAILSLVVILGATGLVSIAVAVVLGCGAMVLSGCLEPREAYSSVEWPIILLIVGMLGIGASVEQSGTAMWVTQALLVPVRDLGPTAVLSAVYLLSVVVTAFLSNTAAAVLLTPIAITAGLDLGLDPRPLAIAVALGASAAYATPISYQTNLFVYGAGGYRFGDFVRAGLPLNIVSWLILTGLVPWIWPLEP